MNHKTMNSNDYTFLFFDIELAIIGIIFLIAFNDTTNNNKQLDELAHPYCD